MALTQAMIKDFVNLARAANRRIERATPGQQAYLQQKIAKYHIRARITPERAINVFSQAKPKTEAEYRTRLKELEKFMGAVTTKRTGWEAVKRAQVSGAGKTLRAQGSNLTDEELATILQEIDEGHSSAEFYKALANVEIAKREAEQKLEADKAAARAQGMSEKEIKKKFKYADYWTPSASVIYQAINERRSAQERVEHLINLRRG